MVRKRAQPQPAESGRGDPRASWKGLLRLNLVTIPVRAVSATRKQGKFAFNQLHDVCGTRIRYEKFCPVHGHVDEDEILSGYQYEKDRYVEFDEAELDRLRTDKDRALVIDTFVTPEQIDPIYYDGRVYYLVPDGAGADQPYAVVLEAMRRQNVYGFGQIVLSGREQLLLLRPLGDVLVMQMVRYANQARQPETAEDWFDLPEAPKDQVHLAEHLIEVARSDDFDLADVPNEYHHKLTQLIEAKVAGQEIPAAAEEEEDREVINLVDALRRSVEQVEQALRSRSRRRTQRPLRLPQPRDRHAS